MDDRELLDEFVKTRSQGAFRELVERHLPVIYSAARRLVRDAHLAEEVAQLAFTTLAQKADSIRPPQVLGGWLYNTTRHLAMHAVRTEQRRRERETTAFAMQSLDQTSDDPGLTDYLEPALAEPGDRAPLFETTTLDGRPVKLTDFKGKYVLLNFWRTDVQESLGEMPGLKGVHAAWGKGERFALLGLNGDPDVATAQKVVSDQGLSWTQCNLGKGSDLPMRYRLRRPTSVLIGPDGLILQPDLRGPAVNDALQETLGAK